MSTTYTIPQVQVFQEFTAAPAEITDPLRAHVSGPHAFLLRYAEADEKAQAALGDYDPLAARSYPWPQRPAGAVVDPAYTKVFVDAADLEYFADLIGEGSAIAPVAGRANRVRSDDAAYGFRANGTAHPRFPALHDRDARVGDRVRVRGTAGGTQYVLDTYIAGFAADQTAPQVGVATADASNGTTRTASAVVTQTAGTVNCNVLVADLAGYAAYGDGVLDDTYTVRVTGSSVDGDLRTATLRVTTASGKDDVAQAIPGEVDAAFAVGVRGLALKFTCAGHASASLSTDDLIVGQTWTVAVRDDYVAVAPASGGAYSGTQDAVYIAEVTRGGLYAAAAKPQVTVTTTTGIDVSGPTAVAAAGATIALGTRGVTLTLAQAGGLGLRKGDRFYVAATAATDGRVSTLVLGNDLPAAIRSASDLDLHLAIRADVALPMDRPGAEPLTNWDQSATQLTVNDGATVIEPSFTDGGVPVPLPVARGTLHVEYRAWRQELVRNVGGVADVGALDAAIAGPLTPDNPLKWGVYKALSNANGTTVKFTAVADPASLDAWADVLATLVGREDVYGLVPLSADRAVHDLFAAHCDTQSGPTVGRWRVCWVPLAIVTERPVVAAATSADGQPVLATIADDPDTAGTQYTLLSVPAGNARFSTAGVRPGDVARVRYSTSWGAETYESYPVDAVISEDTLRLVTGPEAPVAVASRVEVWHPLTRDEQAASTGAGSFGSRRVRAVWPDQFGSAGTAMAGYYLCCMLAGLRSGIVPHQGMTDLEIQGADDLARSTVYFNADQLDAMAASGAWIVTQAPDGTVYTRQAITTDTSDVNFREEMICANFDSISYLFRRRLARFIGVTNVTPTALLRLQVELISAIEFLKGSGFTQELGSQLIDATIRQLRPHALLKDRVVGVVDVTLPVAMNVLELHLVA